MKYIVCFIFLMICLGCKKYDFNRQQLKIAEMNLVANPELSDQSLEPILEPDDLDDESFAHWCFIKSELSDKIHTQLPLPSQYERVLKYYTYKKNLYKQAYFGLYLGRSYIYEKDYSKSMNSLLHAFSLAKKIENWNLSGYISSYIADLYSYSKDMENAKRNYEIAVSFFRKSDNKRSYILALKDISRELAFQDSCSQALSYLYYADSLASELNNKEVKKAIYNSLGNVYRIMKNFQKAENYLLLSISIDSLNNPDPGYLSLSNLYIEEGDFKKSLDYLNRIDTSNFQFAETVLYNKYKLAKKQGKDSEALGFLENFQDIFELNMISKEKSNILELEKKYNQIKIHEENQELQISILVYIVLFSITLIILLVVLLIHQLFKKKTLQKIYHQQVEIENYNERVNELTSELKMKREELDKRNKNRIEEVKLQSDILNLVNELKRIKRNQLLNSSIAKKLIVLSQTHIPQNDKSLITDALYEKIEKEISLIYPNFRSQIIELYPEISQQDWYYCCLILFGFEVKAVSVLLNISPGSVRTRRLRLRQKLGIELKESNLFEFFTNTIVTP